MFMHGRGSITKQNKTNKKNLKKINMLENINS
jgi:hypothetical protein